MAWRCSARSSGDMGAFEYFERTASPAERTEGAFEYVVIDEARAEFVCPENVE